MNDVVVINNFNDFTDYFNLPRPDDKDIYYKKYETADEFQLELAPQFRHKFYGITLIMDGSGDLKSGFWNPHIITPAIYFKSPNQVVSWNINPNITKKYLVVFTEEFAHKNPALFNIIYDFPFFQLDKAVPFRVEEKQINELIEIYNNIEKVYHGNSKERLKMLSLYLKILLLHIKDYYEENIAKLPKLNEVIIQNNDRIIAEFYSLINNEISDLEKPKTDHSVQYFADKIHVHPNYLSNLLKNKTAKTAKEYINEQLLLTSKKLLTQTNMSVKEISYFLAFKEPAHFTNFFKKYNGVTPSQFIKDEL
ncbi:helix-turn-helix domain-containing protein [Chryseobacterium oryctis]|uniref:Helix-turn-helix transcriptional regulator n=1 Tax=Chryseobacterium oryctis TaxID=2952618 RepID=A0ABT3HNP1_9FLAO|nr:helix-turn-helix transcriptional regulator [Chryseobacterium oryctis]MCW3161320.1 helix-turn-helix transcriptional regulator [Chryseobacterium oryctis]